MRNSIWWLAGIAALATLGCSGASSPTSTPSADFSSPIPHAAAEGDLGEIYAHNGIAQGAVAVYTLSVDPESLNATSRLKAVRGAQANDDLYLLPIDGFFNAKSFQIASVFATADEIGIGYEVAHPFPAPSNPTGSPNGSTNRSDLGVAGMVLFLADAPASGNTYFTDRVANTALVTNADAYFSPGDMITTTGLTANTFPFKQLVDEIGTPTGSRVGVDNGGTPTGNFGNDGWTRSEYGTGNDDWTGYGVLHGGQVSANTVFVAKSELSSGFDLDIAVIAKYNDPRGGATGAQKRGNRLPPATPNASLFAYRMPHGALDVSRISFIGESGGFIADNISASTLSFHVEDWDARATESAEADLSLDPSFTNVAQGESGAPELAVCIPGVLGDATVVDIFTAGDLQDDDSGAGGDAGQDSGAPGDWLYYSRNVTKGAGASQPFGDITGMVRATDVEAASPLWLVLTGALAPASNPAVPVTYQAFTVNQLPGNLLPTGDWSMAPLSINNGQSTSVTVSNVVDSDSPTFDIQVNWDNGGGFVTVASGLTPGAGPFGPYGSPVYNLVNPLVGETKNIAVRLYDTVSTGTNLASNVGGSTLTVNPGPSCTTPPSMASVNLQLATLTTGNVLRAGTSGTQVVTGFRLTWADGAQGEEFHSIQRAPWLQGSPMPTGGAFTQIVEQANVAGPNTYNHIPAAADLFANRWVYRIVGRCTAGGADGVASEVAVVSVINFENQIACSLVNAFSLNGWRVTMDEPTYGQTWISCAGDHVNGNASLEFYTVYDAFINIGSPWSALSSPDVAPVDWAALKPTLTTMRYEAIIRKQATGTFNSGGFGLITRAAIPASGTGDFANPMTAGSSRWVPQAGQTAGTFGYNSQSSIAAVQNSWGITGQVPAATNWFWDPSTAATPSFMSYDAASVALPNDTMIGCFVVADAQNAPSIPYVHIDDIAYIWY